ncbi:S-methyl-5-thioribose-1-phosphate isomerase [Desulfobotulus mexicanus]|uniref:Methylthioribose-1-phosphate isomerase n=1 Tax=Desulfobotulus mexicanus TaxID=2586642 RepID=A0A5S5MCI8_9BACT|nr:S-methyl-5-thioribose-1-phosphate isomerase [Desulfobotulus mexicanus]TYT73369.1 S-methyl-5-thioribose-1-phosphate isomerase [Desulfobotulus mexicanus]
MQTLTRPIWPHPEKTGVVQVIDQRLLPHTLKILDLKSIDDAIEAIYTLTVRGAPLIGASAAWAMYLAACTAPDGRISNEWMEECCEKIKSSRPTAVNLAWAADLLMEKVRSLPEDETRISAMYEAAAAITNAEAERCRLIGEHGLPLIRKIAEEKNGKSVNILTHCNAGWLACVEYGTATAPVYAAHMEGIAVHVWVDETRPLNQGSRLTAWELGQAGVDHTIIADNTGGHLMQQGMVDMVIVGTDRTTYTGDVANKIGTYLKALAAKDNGVPFYVALPSSTIDWTLERGGDIPIEKRNPDEVRYVQGKDDAGETRRVLVPPENSPAMDFAFDVTPARLVTGLITEKGVCPATKEGIAKLFPLGRTGE